MQRSHSAEQPANAEPAEFDQELPRAQSEELDQERTGSSESSELPR